MQARDGAQNRREHQRHDDHLQQLYVAVANDIEPLNGIFQYLAVGAVNQLQRKTEYDANDQTDQYFFGKAPLFVAGLGQRKQQNREHDNVRYKWKVHPRSPDIFLLPGLACGPALMAQG